MRKRKRVRQRRDVDVTLDLDGIGSPTAKSAGYAILSTRHLYDGFSLFYVRDRSLMSPRDGLRLRPQPDFLLYQ